MGVCQELSATCRETFLQGFAVVYYIKCAGIEDLCTSLWEICCRARLVCSNQSFSITNSTGTDLKPASSEGDRHFLAAFSRENLTDANEWMNWLEHLSFVALSECAAVIFHGMTATETPRQQSKASCYPELNSIPLVVSFAIFVFYWVSDLKYDIIRSSLHQQISCFQPLLVPWDYTQLVSRVVLFPYQHRHILYIPHEHTRIQDK